MTETNRMRTGPIVAAAAVALFVVAFVAATTSVGASRSSSHTTKRILGNSDRAIYGDTEYLSGVGSHIIHKVVLSTGEVSPLAVSDTAISQPGRLAISPDGATLYVVDSTSNTILAVNTTTGAATTVMEGAVIRSCLTPPNNVSLMMGGATLFVSTPTCANVWSIDPSNYDVHVFEK